MDDPLHQALETWARVPAPPVPGLGPVDHVGIKVADLAAARAQLERLGLRCGATSEHPEVGLSLVFVEGFATPLELLCVASPQSPLAGDADGLHHVAYRVTELRALCERLAQDPRLTLRGGVRRGAQGHDIATFRLEAAPAVAYELVEAG